MKSIEEMKEELVTAGYRFNFNPFDTGVVNGWGFWTPPPIITHFEPPPLAVSREEMEAYIIKTAYNHLEKERQFAAMKALLEEEIEWVFTPQEVMGLFALNAIAAIHLMNVVEKAKKILGGGE